MELLTAIVIVVATLMLVFMVFAGAALFTLVLALSTVSWIILWQGEKHGTTVDNVGIDDSQRHWHFAIPRLFVRHRPDA